MSDAKHERGVMSNERPRLTPPESLLRELLDVEGLAGELRELKDRGHRADGPGHQPEDHPSLLSRA